MVFLLVLFTGCWFCVGDSLLDSSSEDASHSWSSWLSLHSAVSVSSSLSVLLVVVVPSSVLESGSSVEESYSE